MENVTLLAGKRRLAAATNEQLVREVFAVPLQGKIFRPYPSTLWGWKHPFLNILMPPFYFISILLVNLFSLWI